MGLALRPSAFSAPLRWIVLVPALLACALSANAEYAVLRNGQRLHITGYERLHDRVLLHVPGGRVEVAAAELLAIEPEDTFGPPAASLPDSPFGELIRAAAEKYGVDEQLISSIIAVESNFDPRAVSPEDARGLMQLMPETARRFRVGDVFDPAQNIDAGTRYLKELLDRYDNDLALALAAYNAGPDRVEQYRGIPPFPETQNYVKRVTELVRGNSAGTAKRESTGGS